MRLRTALLLAAVFYVCCGARAQDHVWVRANGPDGGDCRAIAFAPGNSSRVLNACYRGVHLSTDGGQTWGVVPSGVFIGSDFAFDPDDSSVVYASAKSSGDALQKSTDGGAAWSRIRITPTDPQPLLLCVAVDPRDGRRIYVGAQNGGVYRTTDGGGNWTQVTSGMGSASVNSILIDPGDSLHIVAAASSGIYVSTNGGDTWTPANNGLGSTDVRDIAASPADFQTLYAATAAGVYKTTDGAANWQSASAGISEPSVRCISVDPAAPSAVFAGTDDGLYITTNSGASWQPSRQGMEGHRHIQCVAIDPADSRHILVGTGGTVYSSTDGGQTWVLSAAGMYGMRCQALSATLADPGRIAVGCGTGYYGAGVYISSNWGLDWEFRGIGDEYIYAAAFGWTDPDLLFASSDRGIFRTSDGGSTWDQTTVTGGGDFVAFCVDYEDPLRFYGGANGNGVWRTLDAGDSWIKCSDGLDWGLVRCLAVNASDTSKLYAGVDAVYPRYGVYHTEDGGDSWLPAQSGVQGVRIWSIAVDPVDGAVYAGGYTMGLFKSTDGGVTFVPTGSGLNSPITCLAVDPVSRRVYGGTWGGLYVSSDYGATFTHVSGCDDLPLAVLVDPNNHNFVYIGTDGNRVWRCSFLAQADTPGEAKAFPDGQLIRLEGCLVSAVFDDVFYVEDTDRSSGIAVVWSGSVSEGETVHVTGTLQTDGGERRISASSVEVVL